MGLIFSMIWIFESLVIVRPKSLMSLLSHWTLRYFSMIESHIFPTLYALVFSTFVFCPDTLAKSVSICKATDIE